MILQTIQPVSILESLQKDSIVFSCPDYSDYPNDSWGFKQSYDWIKQQMLNKGIKPEQNETELFWAWAWSGDGNQKKVDLRIHRHRVSQPHVLLTIEKNQSEVLLSDFNFWHFVLNYWALPKSKQEEKYWDRLSKNTGTNYYNQKPLPGLNEEIQKTWELIFEIEETPEGYFYNCNKKIQKYLSIQNEKQIVQATFWNIKLNEIKNIQMIK